MNTCVCSQQWTSQLFYWKKTKINAFNIAFIILKTLVHSNQKFNKNFLSKNFMGLLGKCFDWSKLNVSIHFWRRLHHFSPKILRGIFSQNWKKNCMFFMRGITTWKKKPTVILSKLINTGLKTSLNLTT